MAFAHLHVHTNYSFLDGAITVKNLVRLAQETGQTALAMTDRGNMYGAVEFFKACTKAGIKPIIGCELPVVAKDATDPADRRVTHMVLLAETSEGYRQMINCVSQAWLDGYHHDTPRVDHRILSEFKEGVIALSGGLAGDVSQAVMRRDMDAARNLATKWRDLFGPENYFIQLESIGFRENEEINKKLVELATDLGIQTVATNNVHYATSNDARAHAALMCIGLGKDFRDLGQHYPNGMWFKPEEEMRREFDWISEAVDNTALIAERCSAEIELGKIYLPQFGVPEGESLADFLGTTSLEGLEQRFLEMEAVSEPYDRDEYIERLNIELNTIDEMGFPGYFLIVWDFIRKARELGVPVGPGRGSGAGSLVAWSLQITDINPIKYGLLFERFLNKERVSMPDFDIDFCMNKRGEVIRYVTEKYGIHNVGQIITYGQLKAKAALRDVGRVLGLSFGEVDRIAKLIPDELGITLTAALEKEPRISELFSVDPRYKELYDVALKVEGLTRHAGMHAAGIVISDEPLWHYVPICKGANGEIVTQYAKDEVEEAGLVKFDFLGLKTLTVIDHAVRLINESRDPALEPFELRSISMEDPGVFELLSSGETTGVFQLESSGFKELMKKLKPTTFEDIVAAVALYRPGPLGSGMVDDFVKRKNGETSVDYPHNSLENTLRETYGVIVYQEQVMEIARIIAGYSLGQADILRRAMGKKKAEVMAEQKQFFVSGAAETAIVDEKTADSIFELMAYFAGYGFNKSHSAAYGLISYQTAYLKAHHPVEFMAALLTADGDNTDKVVRYIGDARSMGIVVRPPDVNHSQKGFSVDNGGIRFGLGAIKNVGEGAVDSIIAGRVEERYTSLFDFVDRVDLKRVNRRVLEALTKSGAFDCFEQERFIVFHNIDRALERGQSMARDRASGQTSLFSMLGGDEESEGDTAYDMVADPWTDKARLGYEKDTIGFYVSGHPLDRFVTEMNRYAREITAIDRMDHRDSVTVAGVVVALRERPLKSGDGRMAFVTLEDLRGQIEVLVFSKVFADAELPLKSGDPLLVEGYVQIEGDSDARSRKLRASRIVTLPDVRRERTKQLAFVLNATIVTPEQVQKLNQLCSQFPGPCTVTVLTQIPSVGTAFITCPETLSVDCSDEFIASVERLIGKETVLLA